MRSEWADARRIVVKIGSALLVDNAAGILRAAWLDALCVWQLSRGCSCRSYRSRLYSHCTQSSAETSLRC